MSGICGILHRDKNQVEPGTIKNMNKKISHRGPDGSKVWLNGPVALGHQMLHTTHESIHETLPWEDKSSGLVITADARIDNRDELSKLLEIENSTNIADSLFILRAYEKWGESCPKYLLGDFCFGIWDPADEILFCARDHMGVKPFYYYHSDDLFLFASEIKAINCILPEEPEINELAIAKVLASIHDDREITFFKNVHRLPGGHKVISNSEELTIEEYWKLDPSLELSDKSEDEYKKLYLDIFSESIKCRLRTVFPIGFTLSGGLDSSSILCKARNLFNGRETIPIHTYSLIFDDIPEVDESYYINAVLDEMEYEKHYIKGDNLSPLFGIDEKFWYRDSPQIGPNSFLYWKLCEKVSKNGVKTLLTGHDGDTVLSKPYIYQTELFLKLKFKKFHNEISCLSKRFGDDYTYYLKNYALTGLIPDIIRNIRKEKSIINEDFGTQQNVMKYQSYGDLRWKNRKKLKKYHYLQITSGHIQKSFEDWDARCSAFSLEARHPFFDKRMVEFCYALPPEQKLKDGWDRIIMRRAMEGIIPPEVQWRPEKSNLSENFIKNLLFHEEETIKNLLFQENHLNKYLKMEELKKSYSNFGMQGKDAFKIWIATTLALWLKRIK